MQRLQSFTLQNSTPGSGRSTSKLSGQRSHPLERRVEPLNFIAHPRPMPALNEREPSLKCGATLTNHRLMAVHLALYTPCS